MRTIISLCALLAALWTPSPASAIPIPQYLEESRNDPQPTPCCSLKYARTIAEGGSAVEIPLNLLLHERVVVDQGSGPVSFKLILTQLYLHGIKETDPVIIKFDMAKKLVEARYIAHGQNMYIGSKYNIDGKVLDLPITGDGNMTIKLDTFDGTYKSAFDPVKLSDDLYEIQFKDSSFDFTIKKAHFDFQNLFNGDKAQGDKMNVFLNEHWEEVFKELKSAVAEVVRPMIIGIVKGVSSKLPYDVVFPK